MSKAAELAALIGSQSALSHRNLIINGAMQVWQRGTTKSLTTSDYFIADRWINYIGTGGAGTASQQVFTLGQTDVKGEPEYYLRHAQTTGASSAPNIQHRIEGVRTGAGQSVTLSFYAKVASSTLTIDPIIRQYFGTGGSPSSAVDHTPTDITVTTSWQKFERTVALTSINGKTIGTDGTDSVQIRLQLPTSTTFTLDIAQVQLELGETSTPFEHRSYGDELARCQRYYEQSDRTTAGGSREVQWRRYSVMSSWSMYSNTFLVQKRANPTIVVYDSAGNANRVNVNDNISDPNNVTPSSAAANNTRSMYVQVQHSNTINGFSYNYSADAEL